jgi:ABC-type lipoprotein export system ATPase subunit
MDRSFLRCEQVYKHFEVSHNPVLANISVRFQSGCTYAIEGISGTGKSTLMHILAGLDQPTKGAVFFNEQNLALMTAPEKDYFLQCSVGLLFQQPYLIKELTVLENVMLPALIAQKNVTKAQQEAQLLIEAVGLIDKINAKPGTLSGGQQQRAALARALINKPNFLLADEPTGNLDEHNAKIIVQLMVKLQQLWGMGIVVSTHDVYVSTAMQQRYVLADGQLKKIN